MSKIIANNPTQLNGWILIDKKKGITSNKALTLLKIELKKILGKNIPKIGHGGTLDPLASGILPVALGEATKTVDYVMNKSKVYVFTIQFGIATRSYDLGTEVIESNTKFPTKNDLTKVLGKFIGKIKQTPPMYSAIKVKGVRAYNLAREGKNIELKTREVNIYNIKILSYKKRLKKVTFIAKVSKGTYIRSLANDISKEVSAIGTISYLRRVSVGSFKEPTLLLPKLSYNKPILLAKLLFTIEQSLDDIPVLNFSKEEARHILEGKKDFLQGLAVNNMKDGVYQAKNNNKTFSLLKIERGSAIILRNLNNLILEETDVDTKRS